jgi:hypothetical protein
MRVGDGSLGLIDRHLAMCRYQFPATDAFYRRGSPKKTGTVSLLNSVLK